jgi:pyruvate dehydrogenase E2 component (dihydrolipoamide acetyltransferase)
MSINVIMPQIGESVLEGTITKWLKKPGENVTRDESLFEVSTDKVDTEIPSPADGVLSQILAPEGKTVKVNDVVAILELGGEIAAVPARAPSEQAVPEPVAAPDPRPVPVEAPAAAAAAVIEIAGAAEISEAPEPAAEEPVSAPETATNAPETAEFIRTSPLVRRIAKDHGVDLAQLKGTGLSGRITKEDIFRHVAGLTKTEPVTVPAPQPPVARAVAPAIPVAAAKVPAAEPPAPEQEMRIPAEPALIKPGEDAEIIIMTPMRKAIAEHMVLSKHTSAHVQTVFEVDMTPIVQLREKHADEFEARAGVSLTYTTFLVKALVETVRDFPILNSSVSGDKVIYKKAVNVGIAVALDTGLIVPVIKDAHLKTFTELALAIHDIAKRARTKKLKPDEVQNGTITVTNPGIFGSLFGMPIINQPQVAILCVGSLQKRPIIIDDAIAIRTMVYLVLSFDHRVIDGAVADQSMSALKTRLQSWTQWRE